MMTFQWQFLYSLRLPMMRRMKSTQPILLSIDSIGIFYFISLVMITRLETGIQESNGHLLNSFDSIVLYSCYFFLALLHLYSLWKSFGSTKFRNSIKNLSMKMLVLVFFFSSFKIMWTWKFVNYLWHHELKIQCYCQKPIRSDFCGRQS